MNDKLRPPRKSKGDTALTLARAGLSVLPYGGTAAELLQFVFTPPLEKRRDEWMEEVSNVLRDLEANRGIKLEELRSNQSFIDITLTATQIALHSSQVEKRTALKNAILNAALPSSIEESLQQMFLAFVDTFTVWHLRILSLFADPQKMANQMGLNDLSFPSEIYNFIEKAFPDLRDKREFYEQVWRDLYVRGLVTPENLQSRENATIMLAPRRATQMGLDFLRFITEPR